MAEKVEVVIMLPKYYLEHPQDYTCLAECVRRGTPLPKGHGRLIDADKLLDSDGIIADSRKCHYIPMIDVYQALTIIEADRAERSGAE